MATTHQAVIDILSAPLFNELGIHTCHACSRFAFGASDSFIQRLVCTLQFVDERFSSSVRREMPRRRKLDRCWKRRQSPAEKTMQVIQERLSKRAGRWICGYEFVKGRE